MTDDELKELEAICKQPYREAPWLEDRCLKLIEALREEREKASKLQEQLAIAIEALEKTAVIYYDPHFNFTAEEIVQRHIANSITVIPILQKLKGDSDGNA